VISSPSVEKLWDALPQARIAGGAVRDTLAGKPVADIDFASPLPPDEAAARLAAAGIKTFPTGIAHGTITAVIAGKGYEITTLRRDIATDGRHAEIVFTDDWEADAARRDFTINAMTMARDGRIFDFFNGRADLAAGVVRFVGDAHTRITEDYLRILRFFRFFARYAKGEPDANAMTAITALRDGILILSAERIWSEMKNILRAEDPGAAITLMRSSGVLDVVVPEGAAPERLNALIARGAPAEPLLRVAALLTGNIDSFSARLKLSTEEAETLRGYAHRNTLAPPSDDADLRRALADTERKILIARTWLAQTVEGDWAGLRSRLAAMPRPVFPLQGRDLTALGLPPGPRIGEILAAVRMWWLANGCTADAQACRAQAVIRIDDSRLRGNDG
jgi:poly(A) polymerase/tRNA nucleotidyltransferase (CCA-adding enzyme)